MIVSVLRKVSTHLTLKLNTKRNFSIKNGALNFRTLYLLFGAPWFFDQIKNNYALKFLWDLQNNVDFQEAHNLQNDYSVKDVPNEISHVQKCGILDINFSRLLLILLNWEILRKFWAGYTIKLMFRIVNRKRIVEVFRIEL